MSIVVRKHVEERPYPKKSERELMHGSLVVINKPKGPFSYHITDEVKRLLRASKTGHAGTLDPNATGTLPIGVSRGCHVLQAISAAPKEYEGVMRVHTSVSLSKVVSTAKKFVGKIKQVPPVRSAVKREEREREIYSLKVKEMKGNDVFFKVLCQAGTYIRKLCSEWGEKMSSRAHLKDLVRTRAGPYTLEDAVSLDVFRKNPRKHLKPLESAVTHLGHVWVDDKTIESMRHGSQPFLPGVYKYDTDIRKGDLVALMTPSQELAALAFALMSSKGMKGVKGQVAKLERVFL
jgi:H/ACA ribonucleoprotein complex subunit 4